MHPALRPLRPAMRWMAARWIGTITHVATRSPLLALTFDDGPNPDATPELLRLLARHRAHATFFVMGASAQRWPDLIQEVARAGHAICNHTWDHPSLMKVSVREARRQIAKTQRVLGAAGHRLFRPPYGGQSLGNCVDLRLRRYRTITWNVDSEDWLQPDPVAIRATISRSIAPGNIYLFHDFIYVAEDPALGADLSIPPHRDRSTMLATIAWVLETYGADYRFVTVPELLASGEPVRKLWYHQRLSARDVHIARR